MNKTKILRWATRKTATAQADATSVLKRSEWKDLMKREFLKNLGLTDEQIKSERKRVLDEIKALYPNEEIEEIQSFFEGAPHNATSLWYLGESIKLLGQADIAYFCKDWEKYRGCCIEHECCVRYSIKHVEE